MTSIVPVRGHYQSEMSELLRKSSHASRLVDSWGYGPNLAQGPIKSQNKPVNGLKLPLPSPFEAAISQKRLNMLRKSSPAYGHVIPGGLGKNGNFSSSEVLKVPKKIFSIFVFLEELLIELRK